ncbi:HEAT repeat domain-containing protein, partial [Planctomycetota bacterium]
MGRSAVREIQRRSGSAGMAAVGARGDAAGELTWPPFQVRAEAVGYAVFATAAERECFASALSALSDASAETRADAAKSLGCFPHPSAARALSERFFREPSVFVRAACITALSVLESREGLPAVQEA